MKDLFLAFYSYEELSEFSTKPWRFLGVGAGFNDAVNMLHEALLCTEEIKFKPQGDSSSLWFGQSTISDLGEEEDSPIFVRIFRTRKKFYPNTFRNRILHYLRGIMGVG